ncbi:hypothetical protein LY90DRAFT_672972 [Neocallimastix californiae]|uniref:RRM domain-containing protein n=1 Tax=Neocallimastix californiae TaxID=1754190 RepID=A0A1Y2BPV5_9FUNG|nr:hypothetical protein LY90DRAFT_672972 [Neocallimastix californiae]|eukprot:ORY36781.1 hypothetical protein LY90DRAFT_672972 [Neocallimastix californiae]
MSEEIVKRLFVGGIADDCTEKDLNGRFERFGKILTVDIPQDVVSGKPKGFGYISIKITEQSFKRCVSLLNKTKWRGKELKIEEAKPDYMQRLRNEWDGIYEEQDKKNKNKLSKKKLKRQQYISEAEDLTPVTDITGKDRKGWVIGRYGRAMTVLKIKNPRTKQIFKYDPSKYKNSLKKLNMPYIDIPINKLTLNYDDISKKSDNKKEIIVEKKTIETNELPTNNTKIINNTKGELTIEEKKELANKKRLEALKEKQERNKQAKQQIKIDLINIDSTEKSKSHIKFDDDGSEENNEKNNSDNDEYISSGNNLKLFDSDEEEEEEENLDDLFKVKKVFEGKSGEERFKLQKSFNGDSRFKLGDEFIDDDEEEEDEDEEDYNLEKEKPGETAENEDIDQEMEEDHKRTFDVLNMIFGEELPNAANEIKSTTKATTEDILTDTTNVKGGTVISTKSRLMWNDTLRYDPDAENADEFIVKDDKESKEEEEEEEELPENKVETSIQAPKVSKEKHFEVSKDLTSILLGETKNESTGFSLFGFRNNENDNNNNNNEEEKSSSSSFLFGFGNKENNNNNNNNNSTFSFSFNVQQDDEKENEDNNNNNDDFMKSLSTSKLFFFHFGDKDLKHRTLYSDTNRLFMRTESIADINAAFEEKKQELTQEFKRKHKSATRKKIKMRKLNNKKQKAL